jgi:LuxR family maltose regulon positive regulatory protein
MTLLRAKFTPPKLRPSLIERGALIDRLNQGLSGDVTLVIAPAGYGKTTLVAEWAAQATLPVAWLTVDAKDNDATTFVTYFIAAIRTLFPEACPTSLGLAQGGQSLEGDLLPPILVNEIDDLPRRFALVIDDYYLISQPLIHDLMGSILRRPPTQLHLIILSRTEPPLALGRLRAGGMLNELAIRDLRFTSLESEMLMTQLLGQLDEPALASLLQRAEGWVTGLYLASLTLRAAADPATAIDSLTVDNNRYVADYLFEQVLAQQTPEVREFLAKTSILTRVSPSLARAVVGPGAAMPTTLVDVERAGLFLNALDSSGEWYAYHPLFRQALQKLLSETYTPEEIAALHLRAGGWFLQHDLIDDALDHALAADDEAAAAQIISTKVAFYIEAERWPALERWLGRLCRETIAARPILLAAQAYTMMYRLRWDAAQGLVHEAEALLASDRPAEKADEDNFARALLAWVRAYYGVMIMEPAASRAAAEEALAILPPGYPMMTHLIAQLLAVALQLMGEFRAAETMLNDRLSAIPLDGSGSRGILDPLLALTILYLAEGYLVQSDQVGQILLQRATQADAPYMKAWACLMLGAGAYYANDLPAALSYYSEGVRLRYGSNLIASEQCLVGLAMTYQALGQREEAQGVLAIMSDFHRELANPMLNDEYRSLQARIALLNGDIATARQWSGDTPSTTGLVIGWIIVPAITQLRIRLASDPTPAEVAAILDDLDRLLAPLVRLRQPTRQVELLSLKAVALAAAGQRPAALAALAEALSLAEPRRVIRPILDAGPGVEPLLEALVMRQTSPFVARLLAALRPATTDAGPQLQPAPRLTPREQEVLVLLSQYCTDRVIAERLVVSPLTVRTHIENLAEKLGVRGRRTIVDRARQLALLP